MKLTFKNEIGLSVVEVILATALFMIFATGAISVVIQGLDANRLGSEETIANQYAAEGLEAVRSIKNQKYGNLSTINPTPRALITQAPGTWTFGADNTNNTLPHSTQAGDNYTRTVTVENVNRDANGDIVPAPTGILDPDVKKITSTVSWNVSASRNNSVTLSTYLTDWKRPINPPMMVYSKTTSTPFYRIWNGTSWSAENPAQNVEGNINFIVLKHARTRRETALGTLDSNGNIYVQIWNGTSWSTPRLMGNVGSANSTTRSFDMDYEKSGDRIVVAYLSSSSSNDFSYQTWDGSVWVTGSTVSTPTTSTTRWIEMTQNPLNTSNEIALVLLDATPSVYGMAWNGTTWNNMGTSAVWDSNASVATRKGIDVAYEQLSGRAMFLWGDSTATDQYYRIWNGTTLTGNTPLDIPLAGATNWVELVSRPNSDELMLGVQSVTPDVNTRKWSGSAWDTATQHPEHDNSLENALSMNFDIVWETYPTNSGKAWILWGDGARVSARQWSGTAWGTISSLNGSDDTSFIRLTTDQMSGTVFAGIYQSSAAAAGARDISERRLTNGGTNWSNKNVIWGGQTTANPVHFRIDIATQN